MIVFLFICTGRAKKFPTLFNMLLNSSFTLSLSFSVSMAVRIKADQLVERATFPIRHGALFFVVL